jgi:hypothetical protein
MSRVGVTIDATDADREIDRVEKRGEMAAASIISHIRRSAQFGMALASATGGALSQQYTLMIEAALVTLDTIVRMGSVAALGPAGLIQATLSGISVILMLKTIGDLRHGKTEAARATNRTIQMFRIFSITG